jgi:hypothetical protein
MLEGPSQILWFIVATVFVPGIALLVLSRSASPGAPRAAADRRRGTARTLGLVFVVATGLITLYLLPALTSGPRGGGLGSMGDPLGALLLLGYVFVLAPVAVITAVTFAVLEALGRRRARHRV